MPVAARPLRPLPGSHVLVSLYQVESFSCPISMDLMSDPVVAADGHSSVSPLFSLFSLPRLSPSHSLPHLIPPRTNDGPRPPCLLSLSLSTYLSTYRCCGWC
eukprot:2477026-Rhodomonas_salina.3